MGCRGFSGSELLASAGFMRIVVDTSFPTTRINPYRCRGIAAWGQWAGMGPWVLAEKDTLDATPLGGAAMPVLPEQVSIYPPALLDGANGEAWDRRWWVLYTKVRQEKAVARDLAGYQVPFYLPLVGKTSQRRGRAVRARIPLFSGYVFLFGSDEERVRALTTNRVSRVLKVTDPDRLLRDLQQVYRLIASRAPLTVESRLTAGDRVRVLDGPMAGLEGTVLTRRGRTRLLVSVNFLQQGASAEIEDYLLEPLD